VLQLLGLKDLLDAGVVLERTHLELQDQPEVGRIANPSYAPARGPDEPEEDGRHQLLVGPDWAQTANDTAEADA
jgi:hypothetical protein